MLVRVLDNEESFKAFPNTSDVKHDCAFAITLFSMILFAMLKDASWDSDAGISLK